MEKTVNKVELSGYVGTTQESRNLSNGKTMFRFSLATNENYKNAQGEWERETIWHNIVLWNGTAVKAEKEIRKGNRVEIIGRISSRSYTGKDGIKRTVYEIVGRSYKIVQE